MLYLLTSRAYLVEGRVVRLSRDRPKIINTTGGGINRSTGKTSCRKRTKIIEKYTFTFSL